MNKRSRIQKVLMMFAAISYFAAVGCGIGAFLLDAKFTSPVIASMMASMVFFACVGAVLQEHKPAEPENKALTQLLLPH